MAPSFDLSMSALDNLLDEGERLKGEVFMHLIHHTIPGVASDKTPTTSSLSASVAQLAGAMALVQAGRNSLQEEYPEQWAEASKTRRRVDNMLDDAAMGTLGRLYVRVQGIILAKEVEGLFEQAGIATETDAMDPEKGARLRAAIDQREAQQAYTDLVVDLMSSKNENKKRGQG